MADFRSLLDVLLRGDKDETDPRKLVRGRPVPVNPQPPVPQRGAFYESRPAQPRLAPQYMVGPGAAYIPVEQAAPRERPLPRDNPGAYETFADYVNAVEHLRDPRASAVPDVVQDPEPWRAPMPARGINVGDPALRSGLEPPDATQQLTPAYLAQRGRGYGFEGRYLGGDRGVRSSWSAAPEPPASAYQPIARVDPHEADNAAWNAARARARAQIAAERREDMSRIPRPGNPLIAQAWARRRDGR